MFRKFFAALLTLTFTISIIHTAGANPSSETAPSPEAASKTKTPRKHDPQRMKIGDDAFLMRKDDEKARLALEIYREQFSKAPDDRETGWRLSMACYFVGLRLTEKSDEKEKIFAEGRDAGQKSIEAADRDGVPCAACHFWTAINMALYGDTVGVFKTLFGLKNVEEHLRKSVAADPAYAYAGAYRLLGLIEQKLPGILGGSNDEARDWFTKAIETAPEEPLNYLFLARLMNDAFDDEKEAIRIARQGLTVPAPAPDRLEAIEALDEIRQFIKKFEPASEDT